jgi:hypothetical protein
LSDGVYMIKTHRQYDLDVKCRGRASKSTTTTISRGNNNNNNNSIQFNSIHVYLHANLTAQMPITKLALEGRKRQQTKNLQKM